MSEATESSSFGSAPLLFHTRIATIFLFQTENSLFYYRSTPPIYLRTVLQGIGLLLLLLLLLAFIWPAERGVKGKKRKAAFTFFPHPRKREGGLGWLWGCNIISSMLPPPSWVGSMPAAVGGVGSREKGGGGETKAGCIGDFPFQPLSARTAYAHAAQSSVVVSLFPIRSGGGVQVVVSDGCLCASVPACVPPLSFRFCLWARRGDCVEMDHWDAYRSHLCFPLPPPAQYWPG